MTPPRLAQSSEPVLGLQDYLAMFRRRRTLMLLFGSGLLILSLVAAYAWPATYKAKATILIEEQEIPSELVHSTITSYADQRIETIKQQVMSRTTLWKVVEQYDLYADQRKTSPAEEVVTRFVKDIEVEVISADVVDKRTQHPTKATIAFTVAYQSRSPESAQKVANELTSLFLGENLKSRERQAQEATTFLKQESESLARHIEEVDAKLATFKRKAGGALPELMPLNLTLMNQADRELTDLDQQIRSLDERKTYLEGELATIKPNTPIMSVTGERILDAGERLKALRAEYAGVSASLASDHPDVMKMRREIQALDKETGGSSDRDEVAKRLVDARAGLAALAGRLGPEHPDARQMRRTMEALEEDLRRRGPAPAAPPMVRPENPAYIAVQAQLNSAAASSEALRASRVIVKQRLRDYAARVERTPELEPEYLVLARDRDTSGQKYQDIRSRLLEAKVSEGLEAQQKGERFSLIDPPGLPEKPDKPNRLAIVLLGVILAVGGGVGSGAMVDTLDRSVHGPESLATLAQAFPLAVVPYQPNQADLARALTRRRMVRLGGLVAVAILALLSHLFWTPMDVIWFAILRKLGLE